MSTSPGSVWSSKGLISSNALGLGGNDPVSFARYTVIPRPDLPITAPENKAFLDLVNALSAVPQRSGFVFDPVNIPNIKFIQDTALTNIGSRVFGGVDFDARYDFDLNKVGLPDMGALNIGAAGFYQAIDKSRANATSALVDVPTKEKIPAIVCSASAIGWAGPTTPGA